MEGAEAVKLNTKAINFLNTLSWMENTTYLGRCFVIDIDFENYGVSVYGGQNDAEEFRSEVKGYVEYIDEEEEFYNG
jgi:hypothetical protein